MNEVRLPGPVKAVRVDDLFADHRAPGQFKFWVYAGEPEDAPPAGLQYRCPCGCGSVHGIRFRQSDGEPKRPQWTWDGNREAPTCAPSIQSCTHDPKTGAGDVKHWHGFLRGGFFVQA